MNDNIVDDRKHNRRRYLTLLLIIKHFNESGRPIDRHLLTQLTLLLSEFGYIVYPVYYLKDGKPISYDLDKDLLVIQSMSSLVKPEIKNNKEIFTITDYGLDYIKSDPKDVNQILKPVLKLITAYIKTPTSKINRLSHEVYTYWLQKSKLSDVDNISIESGENSEDLSSSKN